MPTEILTFTALRESAEALLRAGFTHESISVADHLLPLIAMVEGLAADLAAADADRNLLRSRLAAAEDRQTEYVRDYQAAMDMARLERTRVEHLVAALLDVGEASAKALALHRPPRA